MIGSNRKKSDAIQLW